MCHILRGTGHCKDPGVPLREMKYGWSVIRAKRGTLCLQDDRWGCTTIMMLTIHRAMLPGLNPNSLRHFVPMNFHFAESSEHNQHLLSPVMGLRKMTRPLTDSCCTGLMVSKPPGQLGQETPEICLCEVFQEQLRKERACPV